MDSKERQGFAQEEFMALDIRETKECNRKEVEERAEDFGPDNKWVGCHHCLQVIVSQYYQ
jgi:hypothetical protein